MLEQMPFDVILEILGFAVYSRDLTSISFVSRFLHSCVAEFAIKTTSMQDKLKFGRLKEPDELEYSQTGFPCYRCAEIINLAKNHIFIDEIRVAEGPGARVFYYTNQRSIKFIVAPFKGCYYTHFDDKSPDLFTNLVPKGLQRNVKLCSYLLEYTYNNAPWWSPLGLAKSATKAYIVNKLDVSFEYTNRFHIDDRIREKIDRYSLNISFVMESVAHPSFNYKIHLYTERLFIVEEITDAETWKQLLDLDWLSRLKFTVEQK